MLLIFALTAAYAVICPIITPFGLFYLIMKHGVDRYNLYYAYKRSKISKQIHATAVNSVIVSLLIQQLVLLFFNVIRGQTPDGGPGLPPRAIFSITMFTIFLAMFVGQIFFHMFLGFSPIQYNPTTESPQRSNKNSNDSSRRGSDYGVGSNGEDVYQQRMAPSENADGTELVYGEFPKLTRSADIGDVSSRDDIFQINDDDAFGNLGMTNRRGKKPWNAHSKKPTKRYLPDVLRYDVFTADPRLNPQPPNNSSLIGDKNNSAGNGAQPESTFGQSDRSTRFRTETLGTNGHYGAIDQQPKTSDKPQKRI